MRERPQKADGSLGGWLASCWRRRRLGRSGCLVGSWRGRRLGHAKAVSGPEEACLARGGGEGQAALTALPFFGVREGHARADRRTIDRFHPR